MKKHTRNFILAFLAAAGLAGFQTPGFSDGKTVSGGIIALEKNVTYMIPLGSVDGIAQGDVAEIFRGDKKIAEGRLISVLTGSSIAEIVTINDSETVLESDSVKLSSAPEVKAADQAPYKIPEVVVTNEAFVNLDDEAGGDFLGEDIAGKTLKSDSEQFKEIQDKRRAEREQEEKDLQRKLAAQMAEVQNLQKQLSDKETFLKTVLAESVQLKKNLEQKDEHLAELRSNTEDLVGQLSAAKMKVEEQRLADEAKFITLREEHTAQLVKQENSTRERLLEQESELNNKIKDLELQLNNLKNDNAKFSDQISGKDSMVKALMEERARLKGEVDGLNARLTQLIEEHTADFLKQDQETQKKFRAQSQEMQEKMALMEAELTSVKSNYQIEADALKDEAEKNKILIDTLQKEKNALRVDIIARDQKLSDIGVEMQLLRSELSQAKDRMQYLQDELAVFKTSAESKQIALTSDIEQKNALIEVLSADKESIATELQDRDRKIIGLSAVVEQTRTELKQAREAEAAAQGAATALKGDLDQKNVLLESLEKQKDVLLMGIKDRDQKILDQSVQMDEVRASLKKTQEAAAVLLSESSALKNGLEQKTVALDDLNKEKEALFLALKDRDQKIAALNEAADVTRAELKKVRGSADKEITNLQIALDQKTAFLDALLQEKETFLAGIKEKDQKITETSAAAEQLRVDLKNAQDSAASFQSQAALFKSELDQKSVLLETFNQEQKTLLSKVKDRDQQILDLNAEIEKLRTDFKKEQNAVSASQYEAAALKSALDQKGLALDSLNKEKEMLLAGLKDKDQQLSDVQAEAQQLRDELKLVRGGADKEISAFKIMIKEKDTLLQSVNEEKKLLSGEIAARDQKILEANTAADQIRADLKKTQDAVVSLQNELNLARTGAQDQSAAFKVELDKKAVMLESLDKDRAALAMQLKDREQKISDLTAASEQTRAELRKAQDVSASLEKELAALKSGAQNQSIAFKADLDQKSAMITALNKEKETLAAGLKDKDKQLSDAASEAQKLRDELKSVREGADKNKLSLEKELAALRSGAQNQSITFKADLDQKSAMITALNKEKETLLAGLKDKDQKLFGAESEAQKLRDELKSVREGADKDKAFLSNALKDKENQLVSLNADQASFAREIKDRDQKLKDLTAASEQTRAELKRAQDVSASLEKELAALKSGAQNQSITFKADLDQKSAMITALNKEKETLLAGLKDKDQKLSDAASEVQKLRDELKGIRDGADKDKAFLGNALKDKENQLQKLYTDQAALFKEIEDRDQRVKALTAAVDQARLELQNIREGADKDKAFLSNALKDKENQLVSLNADQASFAREIKDRDQKLKDLTAASEETRAELKRAQDVSASLEKELAALKSGIQAQSSVFKNELDQKAILLDSLNKDRETLLVQLKDKDQKISEANALADQARAELKKSQEAAAVLENELTARKMAGNKQEVLLQGELEQREATVRALNRDKEALNADLRDVRSQLDALRSELGKVKAEAPQKDKEFAQAQEALRKDIKDKESRINALTEENVWLKENVDKLNQLLTRLHKEPVEPKKTVVKKAEQKKEAVPQKIQESQPKGTWEDYYAVVRKMILTRLGDADLSAYVGRAGQVEIEFEILSNGFLKNDLKFYGTNDPELRKILEQCFRKASPFPRFPVNLAEESKIFTIVVEF